jgi:hypothetical protein
MVTREHKDAGLVKRFTVTRSTVGMGWDVREEHGNEVVRQVQYRDWHRVERALQAFDAQGSSRYSTKR